MEKDVVSLNLNVQANMVRFAVEDRRALMRSIN